MPCFPLNFPALEKEAGLIYKTILDAVFGSPGFRLFSSPPRLTRVAKNSLRLIAVSLATMQQAPLGASLPARGDVAALSLQLLCCGAQGRWVRVALAGGELSSAGGWFLIRLLAAAGTGPGSERAGDAEDGAVAPPCSERLRERFKRRAPGEREVGARRCRSAGAGPGSLPPGEVGSRGSGPVAPCPTVLSLAVGKARHPRLPC